MAKIYFETELANEFLKDSFTNDKLIRPSYFFYVYYPFANVEVDIYETAYENFTAMEKYLLALINSNIYNTVKDISEISNIPKEQVEDIIKNLIISNQVIENGKGKFSATKLGQSSLTDQRKNLNDGRRIQVLVDGIIGKVMKSNSFRIRDLGKNRSLHELRVPAFIPTGELTEDNFKQFYDDFEMIANDENSFIPVNFAGIKQAIVKEIHYIPLYIVKFENISSPILLKKHSALKENGDYENYLRPLYINKKQKDLFNLGEDYIISNDSFSTLNSTLNEIYTMNTVEKSLDKFKEIVEEACKDLGIKIDKLEINKKQIACYGTVSKKSSQELIQYSKYIGKDYKYPIVLTSINGVLLYLKGELPKKEEVEDDG